MSKVKSKSCYKIRRTSDGLFSNGGSYPWFTETGKLWKSLGACSGHITMVLGHTSVLTRDYDESLGKSVPKLNFDIFYSNKNPYMNCEIVEVMMEYKEHSDIFSFVANKFVKEQKKEKKRNEKAKAIES